MSYDFGFGIEAETTISFTDKDRIKRDYRMTGSDKIKLRNIGWRSKTQTWNNGWKQSVVSSDPILLSGDGSVTGNDAGHAGLEVQSTDSHSKNVLPKKIIEKLFLAVNDLAKDVTGNKDYRIPNPFGATTGFNKKAVGSYHLSLTLPYDNTKLNNETYLKKYKDKGYRGFRVIRTIEPLFFAMIGGADDNSVGGINVAEGSSRQSYNQYSNMGNVSLTSSTFKNDWYKEVSGGHGRSGDNVPQWRSLMREVDATSAGGRSGDINPKHFSNIPRQINSVEFRFLDPFFVPNVYEVLKVVVAAMEHGKNVGAIEDAKDTDVWNKAAFQCISEGWNARLSKEYQEMIKTKLGLDITIKDGRRADLIFEEVAEQLWKKNKTGEWVKHMFDEYTSPKIINLNRYNWDMQFRHKYLNNNSFEKYVNKLLVDLQKVNTTASDGWIKVAFDDTGKMTVRDMIMNDSVFGKDMGVEDYGDILFLLERIKAVKLKTNPAGHITELKVLYTDPKEIMKKIDNLQTIEGVEETYFGQEMVEVEEEIPTPTPIPTATEGRRASISTSETVNIDMDRLQIRTIIPEQESDLDYNVRDFEGIFASANFISLDGRPFQVETYAAKIEYNNNTLQSFWVRNGNYIKVYLDADVFGSDDSMEDLVKKLKRGFYSSRSVERTTHWMPDLTINDFFGRLEVIAHGQYKSSRPQVTKITLDKAGLEALREYGLRIASLSRGQRYFIVDKKKAMMLKQRYGEKINLIKYMPYQKKIYVQKMGREFRLMMENRIIDKIGGNTNG